MVAFESHGSISLGNGQKERFDSGVEMRTYARPLVILEGDVRSLLLTSEVSSWHRIYAKKNSHREESLLLRYHSCFQNLFIN